MKNFKLGFIGAFVFAVMMFAGCEDACKDVTCLNGGTCLEGICNCTAGYEGTDCGTAYNAKFVGTFNLSVNNCDTVALDPYPVAITASATDPASLTVGGLYENPTGTTVTATIESSNTNQFNIAEQVFDDNATNDNLTITGTGTITDDGNTLTITYTLFNVTQNIVWDGCTDTFTK